MTISLGNRKIGETPNISLIPILDCKYCESCCKRCYARGSYLRYPNVKKCWDANSKLAHSNLLQYMGNIHYFITKEKPKYFRWHVGGDILNQEYLDGMKLIAIMNPETKFLCFTKRFDLKFRYIPDNLKIYFSVWPSILYLPQIPEGIKIAWVQDGTEKRIPKHAFHCTGKCEECRECWKARRDVVFHLHR